MISLYLKNNQFFPYEMISVINSNDSFPTFYHYNQFKLHVDYLWIRNHDSFIFRDPQYYSNPLIKQTGDLKDLLQLVIDKIISLNHNISFEDTSFSYYSDRFKSYYDISITNNIVSSKIQS